MPAVIIGVFIVIMSLNQFYNPKLDDIQQMLEKEFKSIEHMPSASMTYYSASHKATIALASGKFLTEKTYEEVKKYYDDQLLRQGWTFYKEEVERIWGKDTGGYLRYYKKDDLSILIQYPGEKSSGCTYSFGIRWGMNP